MALPVCQFVDRVGSGAVQRLNLNDGKNLHLLLGPGQPNPDFSPPALKRAVVNTLLTEGATIPASAYDNRVIRLPLRVTACDEEEMAEILESLHRELDRGNNILKWHPTYNSRPVYFRTFRSPDYRLDQTMEGRAELRATLAILAEPFAYGDYVEQTGTIYNDPAAVANGIHFEIAAVEGDVPTPLFLVLTNVDSTGFVLGARRHGTPALYFEQAEAMIPLVDTAIQPNDPLMSGAGQNYMKTNFTNQALEGRLEWDPCPSAGNNVNYRGTYRVFVRVRRSGIVGTMHMQVKIGPSGIPGAIVVVPQTVAIQMIDLGLVHIPPAPDPICLGYAGVQLPVENTELFFLASSSDITEDLDWDYAVLVPADEELVLAASSFADDLIFDGPNDVGYHGDTSVVTDRVGPSLVGSIPLVTPNETSLYAIFQGIAVNTLADTLTYTSRYWPRHLYIR